MSTLEACRHHIDVDFSYIYIDTVYTLMCFFKYIQKSTAVLLNLQQYYSSVCLEEMHIL